MKEKDARSLSPAAQEAIRIKAIEAVQAGMKQVDVARFFGVTRQVLGKWVKAYREKGLKALKAKRQGRPKGGSLLPWQAAQIAKTVMDRTPDQLKFPFYLWTREAIAQLIEQRFGKRLSVWTVGRYLKHWDLAHKNRFAEQLRKIRSRSKNGLDKIIRTFASRPRKKKPKYFGGMKWACVRIIASAVRSASVGTNRLSKQPEPVSVVI